MPANMYDMAFKGQVPWHGLGHKVPPEATGEEMLKIAGMDWDVQRRALAMRGADGKNLLSGPLAGYRAIVRKDTDQVFQVSTDMYHPVQNKQVVNFFREYCEAGKATMETVGGLKGGAIVWALARLNGGTDVEIGKGDNVQGYLLMATSHDGSVRTIGKATQICVVCWNTLMAALGEKTKQYFAMKHTRKWTPAAEKEAKAVMGMAIDQVLAVNEAARELSHVQVDDQGRQEFVLRLLGGGSILDQIVQMDENPGRTTLDQIIAASEMDVDKELGRIGKRILEAIADAPGADLPSRKDTLWGAVNGVTYWTDHVRGRMQDNRLYNAWFGKSDDLKTEAVQVAQQMAGFKATKAVA